MENTSTTPFSRRITIQLFAWVPLCLLTSLTVFAQKGQISGRLLARSDRSAIAFATVTLYETGRQTPAAGATSDENGRFVLTRVPHGRYELNVTELNHQPFTLPSLTLSDQQPMLDLGTLHLSAQNRQLAEIQVTSRIGASEITPGKTVYRVADLPVAQGGTAGDVLKLMPSVGMGGPPGVPRDVRYRGLDKAYTLVLIDGRNTGIQGNQREVVVNQIPASAIERIEILSNPGPQYDADGIGGVVNIILKKDRAFGTHGTAGLFVDNRMGYNLSAGVSHKTRWADLYANFDRNQANFNDNFQIQETTRQTRFKNGAVDGYSDVVANEWRNLPSQNLKIGAKLYPAKRSILTLEYLNGFQRETRTKTTDTRNSDKAGQFKDRTIRTEDRQENLNFNQWLTEWRQTMSGGGLLVVTANYVRSDQPKPRTQTDQKMTATGQPLDTKPARQRVSERAIDNNLFAQADFFQPVTRTYALRMGYKFSLRQRQSDQGTERYDYNRQVFLPSANGTDNFSYDERIHAFYLNQELTRGRLRAELGYRHEMVNYTARALLKDTEGSGVYHLPLPVANLFYNIDTTQFIKASVGRRVRRPDIKQLNPFIDDSDPTKIKAGNPDLQPEIAWAYEIGYQKNFRHVNVGVNLFRRDLNNVMQKLITDVRPGVILERQENLGAAYIQGVEFIGALQPARWLNLNVNYSRFGSQFKDEQLGGGALQDQFNWSAKLIADVRLAKPRLFFQAAYNAVGPKVSVQQTENTIQYWDMALSKGLFRNSTVVLRVVDAFATNRKTRTETTAALFSTRVQAAPGRLVSLGYTHNF